MDTLTRIPAASRLCVAALSLAFASSACGSAAAPATSAATQRPVATPVASPIAPAATAAPTTTASAAALTVARACPHPAVVPPSAGSTPDASIPKPVTIHQLEAISTDYPQGLVVGAGSIWTANENIDTVTRIDPTSGLATSIKVAPGVGPQRIVIAGDAVWAAGAGGLVRVDPATNDATLEIQGCFGSLASGFGSIWAAAPGAVLRVDPGTRAAVASIATPGQIPCHLSTTDDAAWLGCGDDLLRLNPKTNAVSATIPDAGRQASVVAADGAAWVLAGVDPYGVEQLDQAFTTAERLDLETNRLDATTKRRLVVGAAVGDTLLVDGDVVWIPTTFGAGSGSGKLYKFEPPSGNVIAAFDVSEGKGYGDNAVAEGYGSLWLASGVANAVRRFPTPAR